MGPLAEAPFSRGKRLNKPARHRKEAGEGDNPANAAWLWDIRAVGWRIGDKTALKAGYFHRGLAMVADQLGHRALGRKVQFDRCQTTRWELEHKGGVAVH